MKFYTSNYAKSGADPKAVSISQGVPKSFKGRVLKSLAPPWIFVRDRTSSKKEWTKLYHETVLDKLDLEKIVNYLKDGAVLLCWESADKFCHRFIVADWLKKAGHEVEEINIKFENVKKTAAPITPKYNMTGLNNAQCEIVRAWEIYSTYPKNHNQAKKIRQQIDVRFENLPEGEKSAVLKVLNTDVG